MKPQGIQTVLSSNCLIILFKTLISNNWYLLKLLYGWYAVTLICCNCEYNPKQRSWNICVAMLIRARSREGMERISQPLSRVRTYYCSRIKVVQTLDSGVFLVFWSLLSHNFLLSLPPILRYGVSWTFLTEYAQPDLDKHYCQLLLALSLKQPSKKKITIPKMFFFIFFSFLGWT